MDLILIFCVKNLGNLVFTTVLISFTRQFEFEGELFLTAFYSRNYYLALPGPEYFPVKLSPEAIHLHGHAE